MDIRNDDLPYLNYLWVGPPRIDNSGKGIAQSDVKDVLDMASKCQNPINFYCLDEHVKHYKKVFKNNKNIKIKSIDAYLEDVKNSNSEMSASADKMIKIKNEILSNERNKIIDRVSFKDAFSLFLLACEGGYTIDTSVRPAEGKDNIKFPSYDQFKYPYTGPSAECWMMYASPDSLNQPREMLDNYLSKWDKIQNLVRDPENVTFNNFVKFHDQITGLTISSIEVGLRLLKGKDHDSDWKFDMLEATDAAALAKPVGLPIVKTYGNTHKPEIEGNKMLLDQINNYNNKEHNINNVNRSNLLESLHYCPVNLFHKYTCLLENTYSGGACALH